MQNFVENGQTQRPVPNKWIASAVFKKFLFYVKSSNSNEWKLFLWLKKRKKEKNMQNINTLKTKQ